jgi:Rieske Fe-S protein
MSKLSKIKIFALSIIILAAFSSCKKDNFRFPYVIIYANIGINSDLGTLSQGSAQIFPKSRFGGVGGLIVYRDYNDDYFVFDAACTYDYINGCVVADESGNTFPQVACKCCGSSFFLDSEGGFVTNGPAKYPLKEYPAFLDGNVLVVNY